MKNFILLILLFVSTGIMAQNNVYEGVQRSEKQRVFVDNYEDNRNLWVKETSPSTFRIADGFLYFSNNYEFPYVDGKAIGYDGNRNFELETRFRFVSGDVEAFNGLMWGQHIFGDKYILAFSSLGYYTIFKDDGLNEVTILEPQKSDLINKTTCNNLVVRKSGDKYHIFINQNWVYTMDFEGLPGQFIGFRVAPKSMIRVSFLRLWYINKQ